jgi:hypothetical protein
MVSLPSVDSSNSAPDETVILSQATGKEQQSCDNATSMVFKSTLYLTKHKVNLSKAYLVNV